MIIEPLLMKLQDTGSSLNFNKNVPKEREKKKFTLINSMVL